MSKLQQACIRSVTIDLDGTLLDTLDDLATGCSGMLAELGLPPRSREQVATFIGDGMSILVERCLPAEWASDPKRLTTAISAFKHHYALANGQGARLYPGVREALDMLQSAGLPLAVVTNKPALFAEPLLQATGLLPYFPVLVCGDSLPNKKPHPQPIEHACALLERPAADNLHIGDSINDLLAARAAGSRVCFVTYGYHHGEPVDTASCDALVSNLLEVAQLFRFCA